MSVSGIVGRPRPFRRIAVIGDVHAEDDKLGVALEAIARLSVDAVVCTGDVVDGCGDADRCCRLLTGSNVLCVSGNHDRWLFQGTLRQHRKATRLAGLVPASRDFLRELPPVRELPIPRGRALLCHGIGEHDLERINPWDTERSLRVNPFLRKVIGSRRYRLMINGHSHRRGMHTVGSFTILNAGTLSEADPGFLVLDFGTDSVQWHAIADGAAALAEQHALSRWS